MPKNVICLWYDGTAEDAAKFYAQIFPDSAVTAVHHAPSDYPDGKQGQVLTVEFTVLRMVQGQMGLVLADHPAHAAGRNDRSRPCGRQASVRGDDENEKDRHRRHRSGTARNCSRLEPLLR